MDENEIQSKAEELGEKCDDGDAGGFYQEQQKLLDEVKSGMITPKQYNEILRKAEGLQEGDKGHWFAGFDELTIVENAVEITLDSGKKARVDAAGLVYKYVGTVRNAYDAQGNRQ